MPITPYLTDPYVAGGIAAVGMCFLPLSHFVRRRTRDIDRGHGLENQIQVIGCCLLISGILLSAGKMSAALAALIIIVLTGTALMNALAAYQAIKETFVRPASSIGLGDRVLTVSMIASCALPFVAAALLAGA